jgi:hypothetical protein
MYAKHSALFLCCLLLGALACKADSRNRETNPVVNPAGGGACPLLSSSDIQAVQGETVSDTQGSERSNEALITSQCFYRLPTFSKSISLDVMRPTSAEASSRAVEEFWERRFSQRREGEGPDAEELAAERKREKERGGERKEAQRDEREREEEEGARPQPVPGLGDEAFWTGGQLNGSLYVRKKNVIVRLSIGGPEDQPTKIKKARTLAEQVLKRV